MNKRIKELRKLLGITQAEFSLKIGLSRNFIAQIETGAKIPSDRTISDICREFMVNEEWLRNGTPPMKKSDIIDEYSEIATIIGEKDPKAKQAIMDYWKLTDADKELFWNFVDTFILKKED